ncbi:MAG: oligosaccharide flippase family protein, partial [Alistipes sp.]|nr:oligosaccharide flippase family protein [Alistipes sp.]
FNNLPALFVGRLYSVTTLGFFNQAQKLKELPVSSTTQAVQNVTFPALSNIDGDERKFAESYRQVVMVVAFAMFPVMTGLSAVAEDTFALLLGEKWMPTVPYFEAICLTGLFAPLASVALNVVKVRSDGRAIVRAEIVKKTVMAAILAATIPVGVMALTWGLVAAAAVEMAVNVALSTRFCDFTARMFLRTVTPPAAISAAMYVVVRVLLSAMGTTAVSLRLAAGIAAGAAVYTALAAAFRLEAVAEVRAIVRKLFTGK